MFDMCTAQDCASWDKPAQETPCLPSYLFVFLRSPLISSHPKHPHLRIKPEQRPKPPKPQVVNHSTKPPAALRTRDTLKAHELAKAQLRELKAFRRRAPQAHHTALQPEGPSCLVIGAWSKGNGARLKGKPRVMLGA